MVLILSVKHDHSTSSVMKWLNFMGEDVVRINSDDDIYKLSHIDQQGIYFTHTITTKVINVLEAKACWWRRSGFSSKSMNPDTQFNPDIVDDDIRSFVSPKTPIKERETNSLIEFIYYKLYSNCFIKLGNPRYNLNRLIVMDIAAKHGFAVPPYRVITNNYQLAECKYEFNSCVSKAISDGIYNVVNNYRYQTYTELIEDFSIGVLEKKIIYFPSLIAKTITKQIEIRSFYINRVYYSMAIFSQSDPQTKVDFRKYNNTMPNRTEPFKLPLIIEEKLNKIFDDLDLNCGSVDLILDDKDEFVFLEINPVGQYAMVSDPCNYNIDHIISKYLTSYPRGKSNFMVNEKEIN